MLTIQGSIKERKSTALCFPWNSWCQELLLLAIASTIIDIFSFFLYCCISTANRTTYRKMSTFVLQDQFRIPCWFHLLSLSEALIQSFCFCFFKMFSLSKYRGKQGIIFSRKLPHMHGRDVMISGLLTTPDVFNGLEWIFDAMFVNLLQGILYDSEG